MFFCQSRILIHFPVKLVDKLGETHLGSEPWSNESLWHAEPPSEEMSRRSSSSIEMIGLPPSLSFSEELPISTSSSVRDAEENQTQRQDSI